MFWGGKVVSYVLAAGPDGSDISNRYDSCEIRIVNQPGKGLFSSSAGLGIFGILSAFVIATIILLSRKGIDYV